ncbi:MAG TPA: integrase [Cytophagales bacterium]|nr:integrase [Cytophagales bacterium]HAA17949.1 integrase [Cytophagales bacterium]HAP62746.1 integrase [Cytophagales bacterium]
MIESFLRYLAHEKRYSEHTLTSYRHDLEQLQAFLTDHIPGTEIEQVDSLSLRAWVVSLVDDEMSARTINRKMASLRSFYKFLMRREVISKDPTTKLRAMKTPKSLPNFAQEPEIQRLLDHLQTPEDFEGWRDRLIIEMLYGTGIRLSELLGLEARDIEWSGNTIKVLGKRNKERVVPFPLPLKNTLKSYLKAKNEAFETNASTKLIVTNNGEEGYPMLVYRTVKRYLDQFTSIDKRSPHVLRHTYATHLLDKGADLNAVKDLLGHASLAATQVYTHNSLDKLKSVFEQAHPKA